MVEARPEKLQLAWLDDQQIQSLGDRVLPLAVVAQNEPTHQHAEQASVNDETLWPTDFSDDSIDIFTNFLCYGAGDEGHPCLTTYCFLNSAQLKSKNVLSLDSLDEILTWAKSDWTPTEPGKIRTVSLLGGEFALHPDAKEILRRVWIAGFNVRIVTNGSEQFQALLDDDDVVAMMRDETRDNLIAVSLDSITEEDNDKNRGKSATRKALDTIEKLNRPGREVPFRINATPLLNCIEGLHDLYKRAEELNARGVIVHYPDAVGRGRSLVPGPQSSKVSQQPDANVWRWVRAGADLYNQYFKERSNFKVRCERGFDEVSRCHLIERSSSLHFAPQITDTEGPFTPVAACAFSMETVDEDSAYILRNGEMKERKGSSQLTTARQLLGKTAFCPLYAGRGCIYESQGVQG